MKKQNFSKMSILFGIFLLAGILVFSAQSDIDKVNALQYAYPDGKPHFIPGRLQAEDYDVGGQGVSYYDTTPGNICWYKAYRFDDVDVEDSPKSGSIIDVGWIAYGEWLEYTVNVIIPGIYRVSASVAAPTGATFAIEIDGRRRTDFSIPPTWGSNQVYNTYDARYAVYLSRGVKVVRIKMLQSLFNLDYISFSLIR